MSTSIQIPDAFVVVDSETGRHLVSPKDGSQVIRTQAIAAGVQSRYQQRTGRTAHIIPSTIRLVAQQFSAHELPPLDAA